MERRLRFRDLNLGCRKALFFGVLLNPATKECLATPVVATDGFESRGTLPDIGEFLGNHRFKRMQPDCQKVEAPLRHGPFPQGGNDFSAAFTANFHGFSPDRIVA